MFCGKCGSTIPDGNVFCSICGAPLNDSAAPIVGQPVTQPIQTVPVVMNVTNTEPVMRKNGMATAGLVFGILAAVFSIATFGSTSNNSDMVSIIMVVYSFATLGVIFSPIGISKSRKIGGKGKAVAGLILSICAFLTPVLVLGIASYMK